MGKLAGRVFIGVCGVIAVAVMMNGEREMQAKGDAVEAKQQAMWLNQDGTAKQVQCSRLATPPEMYQQGLVFHAVRQSGSAYDDDSLLTATGDSPETYQQQMQALGFTCNLRSGNAWNQTSVSALQAHVILNGSMTVKEGLNSIK